MTTRLYIILLLTLGIVVSVSVLHYIEYVKIEQEKKDVIPLIIEYCNDARADAIGYHYSNETHFIDNTICEWQKLPFYPNSNIICNPDTDKWVTGEEWRNQTHFFDKDRCTWKKYTEYDELNSKGCPQFCPKEKSISTVIIPKGAVIEGHEMLIPEIITIQIGVNNTVTWINEDDVVHAISSDYKEYQWGTAGALKPGETYTHTFDNAGVFPYHGEPYPWMTGTIIVLEK